MPEPNNADIARWMGEYKEEQFTAISHTKWHTRYAGPDYLHDPAAALRVLARMSEASGHTHSLSAMSSDEFIVHSAYTASEFAHTPCAAICAAWASEFGGGE